MVCSYIGLLLSFYSQSGQVTMSSTICPSSTEESHLLVLHIWCSHHLDLSLGHIKNALGNVPTGRGKSGSRGKGRSSPGTRGLHRNLSSQRSAFMMDAPWCMWRGYLLVS